MIHGIVKSYGGTILLDTEIGKGTTVHVLIPIVAADAVPEDRETEQNPIGTENILLIDDEEVLADMGKIMLERLGYKVTSCTDSREALRIFQNQPNHFDLIITDQTMPKITGSDLAKQMLQLRPDIPIILCTGYSSIISKGYTKSIGIKAFILKPFSRKDIAQLIKKVLTPHKGGISAL